MTNKPRQIAACMLIAVLLAGCGAAAPGSSGVFAPMEQETSQPSAAPDSAAPIESLRALAQKDNIKASEQIVLTVCRPDENLPIADVPPYSKRILAEVLLALKLRPAAQESFQALPVARPAVFTFQDAGGRRDVYELTSDGARVNGQPCVAQNPEALESEDYRNIDFLNAPLLTLGEAMDLDARDVAAVEWIPASPPSDQPPVRLEGEQAAEAACELLAMIVRPRKPGDNPATGGSDTFRITLSGGGMREVTNFGLVSVDGVNFEYFAVWFFVPYAFSY